MVIFIFSLLILLLGAFSFPPFFNSLISYNVATFSVVYVRKYFSPNTTQGARGDHKALCLLLGAIPGVGGRCWMQVQPNHDQCTHTLKRVEFQGGTAGLEGAVFIAFLL